MKLLRIETEAKKIVTNSTSIAGQLSLPSLRGKLIEYQHWLKLKTGCAHLFQAASKIVA